MSAMVLVTGAAGFIGANLVRFARAAGFAVDGVDIASRSALSDVILESAGGERCIERIARGTYQVVFHQAGIVDTTSRDRDALHAANVTMAARVAEACRASDTLLVHASSGSVYGASRTSEPLVVGDEGNSSRCSGPLAPYAESKLRAEREILAASDRVVIFRYSNVFGAGEKHKGAMTSVMTRMLSTVATGGTVRLFGDTLGAVRDFIPVSHLCQVLLQAGSQRGPCGVFNLGSGMSISFAEILTLLHEWHDAPITVELIDNPLKDQYQYATRLDMTCTERAFGLRVTAEQVRAAMKSSYTQHRVAS